MGASENKPLQSSRKPLTAGDRLERLEAEVRQRHKGDPLFEWFDSVSDALWAAVGRFAGIFPRALKQIHSPNSLWGIVRATLIRSAGFILVAPLYLVLSPLIQLCIWLVGFLLLVLRTLWQLARGTLHPPTAGGDAAPIKVDAGSETQAVRPAAELKECFEYLRDHGPNAARSEDLGGTRKEESSQEVFGRGG